MILDLIEKYFEFFGFPLITGIQMSLFLIILDSTRSIIKIIFILLGRIREILNPLSPQNFLPSISIIVPMPNE